MTSYAVKYHIVPSSDQLEASETSSDTLAGVREAVRHNSTFGEEEQDIMESSEHSRLYTDPQTQYTQSGGGGTHQAGQRGE